MGVDIADFNNDGLPDIITLDMLPEDNQRQKLLQLQENYESFALMVNQGLDKQYMRNMLQLNNGDGNISAKSVNWPVYQIPTGAGARCLPILTMTVIKICLLPMAIYEIIPIKIFYVIGAIIK